MDIKPPIVAYVSHQDMVLAIIKQHDLIATREIIGALDFTRAEANSALHLLRKTGKIHRAAVPNERRVMWRYGPSPDYDPLAEPPGAGQPKRTFVSTWEPPAHAPHSWMSALNWRPK